MTRLALAIACLLLAGFAGDAETLPARALAPEIERGLSIRRQAGLAPVEAEQAIYIDSLGVHHVRTEVMTIAWKAKTGRWTVEQLVYVESSGMLPDVKPTFYPAARRDLSGADGRRLERLLADPALWSEDPIRKGDVGVGSPYHVMQVTTPKRNRVVRWDGRLLGRAGKIADLIIGVGTP